MTVFRPSDRKMSNTSFEFTYLKHGDGPVGPNKGHGHGYCNMVCQYFDMNKKVSENLPIAKPGVVRRCPTNQSVPQQLLNDMFPDDSSGKGKSKPEKQQPFEELPIRSPEAAFDRLCAGQGMQEGHDQRDLGFVQVNRRDIDLRGKPRPFAAVLQRQKIGPRKPRHLG